MEWLPITLDQETIMSSLQLDLKKSGHPTKYLLGKKIGPNWKMVKYFALEVEFENYFLSAWGGKAFPVGKFAAGMKLLDRETIRRGSIFTLGCFENFW